ncbi:MAG: AAA family ATPase [Candidatus Limisoma sp.]|nr:AAA family ATPase [Bacteroidales bacterium]MDY4942326.1 AAA family ATPase [Candidatus Limisoma sp.]MDD7759568.1 AAA family ATPase [Bacteroidales bacterium]MDY5893982.1 AAA family ATPase [Candidatus Limisoma sp.]MDY5899576.1 AAA family ATPase [Candidatus Limisoma sp.]
MYCKRLIDNYLSEWASRDTHKPVLLRGARQVGKSTAVKELSKKFDSFVEINFEKQPKYKILFDDDLDVKRIVPQISAIYGTSIKPGQTLLFLDEIQECPRAIMALRFFKEDMPELHVIAAGSLLEFALKELPTFGVGRIHSMFMYPMTFDEFLEANGQQLLIETRNEASIDNPLPEPIHNKLVDFLRTYMLVGGMPEAVKTWVEYHDYIRCQEVQDDIVVTYEDDFPKYKKNVDPTLLRRTLRSVAVQAGKKFVYTKVGLDYKTAEVKKAVELLTLAGILHPVTHTDANGLPLGSEEDKSYQKMLLLDTGLLLRLLNMSLGDVSELTTQILTASATDLANKGPMAEMVVGLEMLHNMSPNIRHELYYWVRHAKNSQAEIDYIATYLQTVVPIEVKADTQGGMKSLWAFMRDKRLHYAIRCSMENFGKFDYVDNQANNEVRHVRICPMYAIARIEEIKQSIEK